MAKAVVTVSLKLADNMTKSLKNLSSKLGTSVGPLGAIFGVLGAAMAAVTTVMNTLANVVSAVVATFELFGRTVSKAVDFVVGSIQGLIKELKNLFTLADKQQKADILLAQSLSLVANEANVSLEVLVAFSDRMQDLTNISDDVVSTMQSIIIRFTGVTEILEDATLAALDMSVALGVNAVTAARQFGRALADPSKGLESLRELSKLFSDEERELIKTLVNTNRLLEAQRIITQKVADTFGGAAQAAANRFAGEIDNINNRIEDFQQALFTEAIQKGLEPFAAVLTELSDGLILAATLVERLGEPLKAIGEEIASNLIPIFGDLESGIVTAFAGVETLLENWRKVLELMGIEAELAFKDMSRSFFLALAEGGDAFIKGFIPNIVDVLSAIRDPFGTAANLIIKGSVAGVIDTSKFLEELVKEDDELRARSDKARADLLKLFDQNRADIEAGLENFAIGGVGGGAPVKPFDPGEIFGGIIDNLDLGFDVANAGIRPDQAGGPSGFESAEQVFRRISAAAGKPVEEQNLEVNKRQEKILEKIEEHQRSLPEEIEKGLEDAIRGIQLGPSVFPDIPTGIA